MADRYYNNVFWPKVTTCPSCGKTARPIHKRFIKDPGRVFCRFCGEEVKLVTNRLTNIERIWAASEDEIIQWYCRHRDCGTCDYGHGVDCTIRAWLKSPAGCIE